MAEIRTVTTLRSKRDEIVHSIRLYERQLEQARADLAHVTAAIRIFEASGNAKDMPRYVDTHRLFKRGETWALCQQAIGACLSSPRPPRILKLSESKMDHTSNDDSRERAPRFYSFV
jgi:hypothetical protein